MLINISTLQTWVPTPIKYAIKPYYRKVFPNRLMIFLLPTYRCNYRCSYCMVVTKHDYTTFFPKSGERTAAEWCAALEKLPPAQVYIQGGEPMLYAELPELLNRLPAKHQVVGMVTNLSMPVSVYQRIRRKMHLNASLHREHTEPGEFLEKVKELSGQFHVHVNLVATPENITALEGLSQQMR